MDFISQNAEFRRQIPQSSLSVVDYELALTNLDIIKDNTEPFLVLDDAGYPAFIMFVEQQDGLATESQVDAANDIAAVVPENTSVGDMKAPTESTVLGKVSDEEGKKKRKKKSRMVIATKGAPEPVDPITAAEKPPAEPVNVPRPKPKARRRLNFDEMDSKKEKPPTEQQELVPLDLVIDELEASTDQDIEFVRRQKVSEYPLPEPKYKRGKKRRDFWEKLQKPKNWQAVRLSKPHRKPAVLKSREEVIDGVCNYQATVSPLVKNCSVLAKASGKWTTRGSDFHFLAALAAGKNIRVRLTHDERKKIDNIRNKSMMARKQDSNTTNEVANNTQCIPAEKETTNEVATDAKPSVLVTLTPSGLKEYKEQFPEIEPLKQAQETGENIKVRLTHEDMKKMRKIVRKRIKMAKKQETNTNNEVANDIPAEKEALNTTKQARPSVFGRLKRAFQALVKKIQQ